MTDQEKILQFIERTGPTVPTKVAKFLNTQILFASAHLSDLKAQGKISISHLQIGGSPLYYLPSQKPQLEQFASGNVNPKDYAVMQHLQQQKILREVDLDLLSKVALRTLRDFAIPIQVTIEGKRELFWRWYLVESAEANTIIARMINPPQQPVVKRKEAQQELQPEEVNQIIPQPKKAEVATESPVEQPLVAQVKQQAPTVKLKSPETTVMLESKAKRDSPLEEQKTLAKEERKSLFEKVKAKIIRPKKQELPGDKFLPAVQEFLQRLEITIEKHEVLRKNAEIDLTIKVPSAIGQMTYFCKAKNKKRADEKDLSAAYMEAQIKKLPLLFLYSDQLTSKAQEMLTTDAFPTALVQKIE